MSGDAIEKCKGASVASPLYLSALVGAFLCSVPAHALASGKSAERPRLELRPRVAELMRKVTEVKARIQAMLNRGVEERKGIFF